MCLGLSNECKAPIQNSDVKIVIRQVVALYLKFLNRILSSCLFFKYCIDVFINIYYYYFTIKNIYSSLDKYNNQCAHSF